MESPLYSRHYLDDGDTWGRRQIRFFLGSYFQFNRSIINAPTVTYLVIFVVSAKCCERDLIKNLCLREEIYDISYMRNLKRNDTHELTYKTERDSQTQRTNLWLQEGRRGEVREFGMDIYTMLYLKWINNKDLLYSTGNSAECYVAAQMSGGFGGKWIHVYIWLNPFAGPETITASLTGYTPIQNKKLNKTKQKEILYCGQCLHHMGKPKTQEPLSTPTFHPLSCCCF